MYDIIIRNGKVIDRTDNINEARDIYIKDGYIVSDDINVNIETDKMIDAEGCLVVPGLIDAHLHVFDSSNKSLNVNADAICLPNGVTTCIDGGSSGPYSFENFYHGNIAYSKSTIKALLHVSFFGIHPRGWGEVSDPESFDVKEIKRIVKKYSDCIVGLKIRQHKEVAENLGIKPLQKAIDIANELEADNVKCSVTVHVTDLSPEISISDITKLLRPGDVYTHAYQPFGETILDDNKKVKKSVWEAKERGVIFDCGCATRLFSLDVLRPAFEQGFFPDVIGTDTVGFNVYKKPLFTMPYIMSLFLNAGMPLEKIIEALTKTPAQLYNLEKEIGTLRSNSCADVTILKIIEKQEEFKDVYGNKIYGDKLFLPMATIKDGQVVFQQIFM